MNKNQIILVAIGSLIGLVLFGSAGKLVSDKVYEHKKEKPSDWSNKTRVNLAPSRIIYPNPSAPVKFNSEAWSLPNKSHHRTPNTTSGGTRRKRRKRNGKQINKKKSRI